MALEEMLKSLRQDAGALASAVVSKDGLVIASDMPAQASKETFSIMCATILGAGLTAMNELGKAPPRRVVVESPEVKIVIYEAGRRWMVVLVLPPDKNVNDVDGPASKLIAAVERT